jgi:hypothetical protein
MNKKVVFLAIIVAFSNACGQSESDDEAIREAINELIEVRKSEANPAQKNRAVADFYERIRSRGDFVSLDALLENRRYFNVAFGQALKDNGSVLADRIYCQALMIPGYFSEDGRPGHQCNLAKMYLLNRFDLDSNDPRIKKMFDAFIDPKFLDQLSSIFQAIINAKSEEAKKEQERRAVTFLLSYDYKYWTELLGYDLEQQPSRRPITLPAEIDPTKPSRRDAAVTDHAPPTVETPPSPTRSWALWTSIGVLILAVGTYLIRRRPLKG